MIFPLTVVINFSAPPSGKPGKISRVSFRYLQLPNAPTHTGPWLPHHAKTGQPPGFSGDGEACAGKFPGWTMAKNTDSPMKFQEKESEFYFIFESLAAEYGLMIVNEVFASNFAIFSTPHHRGFLSILLLKKVIVNTNIKPNYLLLECCRKIIGTCMISTHPGNLVSPQLIIGSICKCFRLIF